MKEKILFKWDYLLYKYFSRLSLPHDLRYKFELPSKRLIRYVYEHHYQGDRVPSNIDGVAYAWAYDKTISLDNLGIIKSIYKVETRERLRQYLAKFVTNNYR